jgi:AraC family transcriptional regulator, ethanolamine operon transcriptional activator
MPREDIHRYQDIARRFEEMARENLGKRASIIDLCRAAAVNQRTLLRAVRAIHGMTPRRYLHDLRLAQARRAFLCTEAPPPSVTQVALRCGFLELGRFAVDYRARFGESPSDTLRRTASGSAGAAGCGS